MFDIIPKSIIEVMSDLAILGAVLVSLGFPFYANVIWMISNPYMTWHNYKIKQLEQARLFGVFTIIALYGIWNLWPK